MLYIITYQNHVVGKFNVESMERWLLKRRTQTQTEHILENLSMYGRSNTKDLVIKRDPASIRKVV